MNMICPNSKLIDFGTLSNIFAVLGSKCAKISKIAHQRFSRKRFNENLADRNFAKVIYTNFCKLYNSLPDG